VDGYVPLMTAQPSIPLPVGARRRWAIWAGSAFLAAAACMSPTDVCGCEPSTLGAVLAGRVTSASGEAAVGAVVQVSPDTPDCVAGVINDGSPRSAAVGATGRYSLQIRLLTSQPCLRVVATTASDTVAVIARGQRIVTPYGSARMDTVRVDLVFPSP
jgi:hypothetical protein